MDPVIALLTKMDERLARQDEILARQAETLRQIDNHITQAIVLADTAAQQATAAHQAMAVALTKYAETRLDIDRFIATADRVLASWERQRS